MIYNKPLTTAKTKRLQVLYHIIIFLLIILSNTYISCNKIVEIDPPASSITTSQVFKDSADANAAIMGIYSTLGSTRSSVDFGSGAISVYLGLYADELIGTADVYSPFYLSSLNVNNSQVISQFWKTPYKVLYMTNACIEGLEASKTITDNLKRRLVAEATVLRALCYFHLINTFGGVPYVVSTEWKETAKLSKSGYTDILNNLITDLEKAYANLPEEISNAGGGRMRINKWTCYALLAKLYLFNNQYEMASKFSDYILTNKALFDLETNLNNVFSKGSKEVIFQWELYTNGFPYNATPEGYFIVPSKGRLPKFYITDTLLNSFELGDKRKERWIKLSDYPGYKYYFPYKYKIGIDSLKQGVAATEQYTVFRVAEQYLINAEANARMGNIQLAVQRINAIRERAGLSLVDKSINQQDLIEIIFHERQIELFCEWGNRLYDLRRFGKINTILGGIKPTWKPRSIWFPIPADELKFNPFLEQNEGY